MQTATRRLDAVRCGTIVAVLFVGGLIAAPLASGQAITGPTATRNAGNTADSNTADVDIFSAAAIQPGATATTFTGRYSAVVLADTSEFTGGSLTATLNSDYQVSFTVTAPGDYFLTVNTNMSGAFSTVDDTVFGGSAIADSTAVTGSVVTGAAVATGGLGLTESRAPRAGPPPRGRRST